MGQEEQQPTGMNPISSVMIGADGVVVAGPGQSIRTSNNHWSAGDAICSWGFCQLPPGAWMGTQG